MKNIFKALGLFAIVLTMCLTSCSRNETNSPNAKEKAPYIGEWTFEMQGDDVIGVVEDDVFIVDVVLEDDRTSEISVYSTVEREVEIDLKVKKDYYIVENISELTEEFLRTLYDDEYNGTAEDTKCTFLYDSATARVHT